MRPRGVSHVSLPLLTALALAGCGGSDGGSAGPAGTQVNGIAAVGAPVTGATVTATCDGGSVTATATTSATGSYTLTLPAGVAPCALRVSGGSLGSNVLHSFTATGSGTLNITPLTDLILALSVNDAAAQTLAAWFAAPSNWGDVDDGLDDARTALASALTAAGYVVPASFDPFAATFTAQAGNAYDDLLEAIAAGIAADAAYDDYADFLAAFVDGGDFPAAVDDGDDVTDPEAAAGLELVAIYAGTWQVSGEGHVRGTVTVSVDGATIDFDTGKSFAIEAGNVYNRIPNFLEAGTPRVQIEINPGPDQERLRIFVDPDNLAQPLSFVYYPDANSDEGITATVTDGSGGGGGGDAIGKAGELAISGSSTLAETAAAVVGSYDVAIYRSEDADDIGAGTLDVAYDGTDITFTLKRADGTVLSSITRAASDTACGDGRCVQLNDAVTTPVGGRRIGLYDYYESNSVVYLSASFLPDGYVYGSASAYDTSNQILFRNDVLAYGASVPAVFATLAGTFSGGSEALGCDENVIAIDVTSGGSVQVTGKSSVSCAAQDITVAWDGIDDFIAPTADGAQLVLDSLNIGGSSAGGGLVIDLPDGESATVIDRLYTNFAGAAGNITVNDPARD